MTDRHAPRPCEAPGCSRTFTPRRTGPIGRACSDACRKRLERAGRAARRATQTVGAATLAGVMGYLYGDPDAGYPTDWAPLSGVLDDWAPELLDEFRDLAAEADAVAEGPIGLVEMVEEWPLGIVPSKRGARRSAVERAISQLPGGAPYGTGFGVEGDAPGCFDPRRIGARTHRQDLAGVLREAAFDVGSTRKPSEFVKQ